MIKTANVVVLPMGDVSHITKLWSVVCTGAGVRVCCDELKEGFFIVSPVHRVVEPLVDWDWLVTIKGWNKSGTSTMTEDVRKIPVAIDKQGLQPVR